MSSFTEESRTATTSKTFYTNLLPLSTNQATNECYNRSVELSKESIDRNKRDHYKGDEPNPHPCLCENVLGWDLNKCGRCGKDLGLIRLAEETRLEKKAQEEDRIQAEIQPHADRIHSLGVTTGALIAFAYKHDCWLWPTWQVVRDIVVPATSQTRCRYADLQELKGCFGPATVFMSHCWGAKFGDLIGAACHGARKDRVVWIDIFAVRQWPGNVADLDFRGIIGRCDALVVSTSPVDGLKEFLKNTRSWNAFLASDEGKAAKKTTPFFRLWCVVELVAAIKLEKEIVIKGGSVRISNEIYEYDTKCIGSLMNNLKYMIDVDASECAVQADYNREIAVVRSLEGGSKGVNALVAGVVNGGHHSINNNILEIDAFVCNEPESFRALNIPLGCEGEQRKLADRVLTAACGGGRESIVKELLSQWNVKESNGQNKEGETKRNDSMKKEKEKKGIVYDENDGRLYFMCIEALGVSCRNSPAMDDRCKSLPGVSNRECVVGTLREDGQWLCIVESNDQKQNGSFLPMAKGEDIFFKKITTKMEWIELKETKRQNWLPFLIDDSQVLWNASSGGHVGVVERILEVIGINVNVAGGGDSTPLYVASDNGHVDIVNVLLTAKDINVNQSSKEGLTPLYVASQNGDVNIVKILLAAKDININQANNDGCTPLYVASQNGHIDVVQQLLTMNDINLNKDLEGTSPLQIAIVDKHIEIIQLLKDAGATYKIKEAVAINDIDYVQEWLHVTNEKEEDRNEINELLYNTCELGHVNVANVLLGAENIDVNWPNEDGITPLIIACNEGHVDLVRLLVQQPDIDLDKEDEDGDSALGVAITEEHAEIIQLLKVAGVTYTIKEAVATNDINYVQEWITDEKEKDREEINESLYAASANGKIEIVRLFVNFNDININYSNTDGTTFLFIACQNNHPTIAELLLQQPNIDVNISCEEGDTPLIIASYLGNYECVQQLIQHPTTNTILTCQNKTALQWSQPNERATGWEFLESRINIEGRQKILQLFTSV